MTLNANFTKPATATALVKYTDTSSAARHAWLEAATNHARALFGDKGFMVPVQVRVSIGWPAANVRKTIGQCWSDKASTDKHHEVFISPSLRDTVKILGVLVHELAHAVVGTEHGHKRPFKVCAEAVGLCGKMTATSETPDFVCWARDVVVAAIGEYPCGGLTVSDRKKQTTRLVKCECSDCGYTVRTTSKWLDKFGAPLCPDNQEQMWVCE